MVRPINIKRHILENGLTVVGCEDSTNDTVAIRGSVKAGAIFDEPNKLGNAELVSRLLSRGTKNGRNSSQISQMIEEIGATLQFTNGDESVSFSANCYSGILGTLIEILSDCLMNPSFPQAERELVRAEIISNIKSDDDDTRTKAYRQMVAMVFGKDEPYGRDPQGTLETVPNITNEDVKDFYLNTYVPENVIVAASGNFHFENLISQLETCTKSWKDNSSTSSLSKKKSLHSLSLKRTISPRKSTEIEFIPMKDKSQVDLALGVETVPRKSEEYYPLNLGNLILGRIGLYGRLGKSVREQKGLAYYSFSALQSKTLSGHLSVYAGVNPKNLRSAFDEILDEISRMRNEEIGQEELLPGKRNLIGSLSIALDTSSERVNIIHDIEYYNLGVEEYLSNYDTIVNSISAEQIRTVFERFAKPEYFSLVAAGPVAGSS